jgi:hypothetical protein
MVQISQRAASRPLAIQQTIGAASVHGLAVASGLLAARWLI